MVNYQNGKIYAIRSFKTDEIYIGSTTQKLCQRLQKHKADKKRYEKGIQHYYTSFKILDYDDAYIELIENVPCNSKEELHKIEGKYIREMICVNKNITGRTLKEYYKENKDIIKQKNKEYYEKNKEAINQKNKEYQLKNKEQLKQKAKKYNEKNKEIKKQKNKEYKLKNKEIIKQKDKEYYEKNKEIINEKAKEKVKCPQCDKEIRKDSMKRHIKSIH